MKILMTGGGTGGHFYPIVAVARALKEIAKEKKFVELRLILMSDYSFDKNLLKRENIEFKKVSSGKLRRYFSLLNIVDFFKTLQAVVRSIFYIYYEFPDVVFGKGGYVSFPALFAARLLKIPVVIHESDAAPGMVNKWAGKFAKRIAVAFPESAKYFPKERTALTGNPIRKSVLGKVPEEGREIFNLEPNIPVLLIMGGSQGSRKINNTVLEVAGDLVGSYQIIHQCGKNEYSDVSGRLSVILENSNFKSRYHLVDYLNSSQLKAASSAADLVVSRAGASSIFEIAAWGLPSILIPLKNSAQLHQRKNALSFARAGAAEVIEEENLSPHILIFEIKRLLSKPEELEKMKKSAVQFARLDSARRIAEEIVKLGLEHA